MCIRIHNGLEYLFSYTRDETFEIDRVYIGSLQESQFLRLTDSHKIIEGEPS